MHDQKKIKAYTKMSTPKKRRISNKPLSIVITTHGEMEKNHSTFQVPPNMLIAMFAPPYCTLTYLAKGPADADFPVNYPNSKGIVNLSSWPINRAHNVIIGEKRQSNLVKPNHNLGTQVSDMKLHLYFRKDGRCNVIEQRERSKARLTFGCQGRPFRIKDFQTLCGPKKNLVNNANTTHTYRTTKLSSLVKSLVQMYPETKIDLKVIACRTCKNISKNELHTKLTVVPLKKGHGIVYPTGDVRRILNGIKNLPTNRTANKMFSASVSKHKPFQPLFLKAAITMLPNIRKNQVLTNVRKETEKKAANLTKELLNHRTNIPRNEKSILLNMIFLKMNHYPKKQNPKLFTPEEYLMHGMINFANPYKSYVNYINQLTS